GQEHHQSGPLPPLGAAGREKLVDDHLGGVGEIAKLRFPQDEGVGCEHVVSVLKTQYGSFGKGAVVYGEGGPRLAEKVQGGIGTARLRIVQYLVTLCV